MPIACGQYDYFEIVCMRKSKVVLELDDNRIIEGIAIALSAQNGYEYLHILERNNDTIKVDLMTVIKLSAVANTPEHHNFTVTLK